MTETEARVRALGLCSGGLDSILSALVLRDQGVGVEWISFETPFFSSEKARRAAEMTGVPLRVADITPVYMEMLKNPRCGYGQHMNPCMDCHALMFRLAGDAMDREGFHFLFSGEVLAQRPMSQTRLSLRYVEKRSGREGYILRPLSARKLPETVPEREGWVDRGRLLDLAGRSRKPQIALAGQYGITDYPAPAGGCLLTDAGFSSRLRDLFGHQSEYPAADLHLLRHGRHLRLDDGTKLIVGRTNDDNESILKYYDPQRDWLLWMADIPGPVGLVPGGGSAGGIAKAAAITAGYSKTAPGATVEVMAARPEGVERLRVAAMGRAESSGYLI